MTGQQFAAIVLSWLLCGVAVIVNHWRTSMEPRDWWALVACSLLMGGTFIWMLVVATGS